MAFTCAFSSAYSSAFAICDGEPPVVATEAPTLRGVPSAIPRPRKRPDVIEASGVGYVSVLGTGRVTGEACLAGELRVPSEGTGTLITDAIRYLVAAIRTGAEALLTGECAATATVSVANTGAAVATVEGLIAGIGAIPHAIEGRMVRDCQAVGLMPIRAGAEAVIVAEDSEEWLILAAGVLLRLLLSA